MSNLKLADDVKRIILNYIEKIEDNKIFFQESIPQKKLNNAIKSFAFLESGETPLVLLDDTLFGSSKNGAVLTKMHLYVRNLGEKPQSIAWDDVESVEFTKNWLMINKNKFLQATSPDESSMHIFSEMIQEIIKLPRIEKLKKKNDTKGLVKLLSYNDSSIRKDAATALGEIGNNQAVEPLINALKDREIAVRENAVDALVKIGKPSIKSLVEMLSCDDRDLKKTIAMALNRLGWEPKSDEDKIEYFIAVEKFGELKNFGTLPIESLIELVRETKNPAAIAVLCEFKDLRVVELLIELLEDPHLRPMAISTLTQLDTMVVQSLAQVLKHSNWAVREAAVKTLGRIKAIEPLIEAIGDAHFSVRKIAIEALGKSKDPQAIDPLVEHLGDSLGDFAVMALAEIGTPSVEPLIKILKVGDQKLKDKAASALEMINWEPEGDEDKMAYFIGKRNFSEIVKYSTKAVEPLAKLLEENDINVRQAVAEALGNIGDNKVIEPLIKALQDNNVLVQNTALKALVKIGEQSIESLIAVVKDEQGSVREKVAEALGAIGDTRAVESLITALKDKDTIARMAVVKALMKLRDYRIVEPLIAIALEDKDPNIRRVIINSIINLKSMVMDFIESDGSIRDIAGKSLSKIEEVIKIEERKILEEKRRKAAAEKAHEEKAAAEKAHEEYLLREGLGRSCSLCGVIGTKGPWDLENGRDILQQISNAFYHIVKELPNGWMGWKMCTMRIDYEFFYKEPKFYCTTCGKKIQQWVTEYGNKILECFQPGTYPYPCIRKIGYKLYELGGQDLMMMASYYAVYYTKSMGEIDNAFSGIGEWMETT